LVPVGAAGERSEGRLLRPSPSRKNDPVDVHRGPHQRHSGKPAERGLGGLMDKFVFLFRKSADPSVQPSPAEMQAGYQRWKAWRDKYAQHILDQPPARSGPKPGGGAAVCRGSAVTDGPYVEGKEIVGGWAFIE